MGLVVVMVALVMIWRPWATWERGGAPKHLEVRLGAGERLVLDDNTDGPVAVLSPDGEMLVYAATQRGTRRLFTRRLSGLESRPVSGTEDAVAPFFSPDGRWVAFFARGKLWKVSLAGGAPIEVADAIAPRGGAWGADDTIVFTQTTETGLVRVAATGGEPSVVTTRGDDERSHRWPCFLPGGKAVLFVRQNHGAAYDDSVIEAVRLDTGDRRVLVHGGTFPRYLQTGELLYVRERTLFALPFDAAGLERRGDERAVLSGLLASGGGTGRGNGSAQFAIAENGTAVYLRGETVSPLSRFRVMDRTGAPLYTSSEVRDFRDPRFSPDGSRVAVSAVMDRGQQHLYVVDFVRSTTTRVTFDGTINGFPVWTPDARELAYFSDRVKGGLNVFVTRADGAGEPQAVTTGEGMTLPMSFSPDGKHLTVMQQGAAGNMDARVLSLETDEIRPFGDTATVEITPKFCPNGHWIVYHEGVGAATEVYVRPYPGPEGRWQISSGGGGLPAWTKNGGEIVYVTGADRTRIMAVEVDGAGDAFKAGPPRQLFESGDFVRPSSATWFDASPDGTKFTALVADEETPGAPIEHVTFIFNFTEEIRSER